MAIVSHVVRFLAALIVLAAGDVVWLGWFGKAVVRPTLGPILLDDVRWWPIFLFYPLFAFGLVVFAVSPSLRESSWVSAFLYGALFGFLAYATYDLTNLATIRVWTVQLAAIDTAWGAFLAGAASLASYAVTSRLPH
jgi:uncharacterized membrane protein